MIGIDRCLTLILDLSKVVGFGIVQQKRAVLREHWMVFFERPDIIGVLLGDGVGHVFLTAHGLDRHEASLQVSQR